MNLDAWTTFLKVEETKADSTVDDLLRCLRRMERRGYDPDAPRPEVADFLKHQRGRGVSEYKKNVQVANAVLRFTGSKDKFPYPRKKRSQPVRLKDWEIERLRAYGHKDPLIVLRNRALVAFALQTGLRRVECSRFNASDLDTTNHTLHIPRPAKGGLVRTIPLDQEFLRPRGPFMSWLRARPTITSDPDAVWIAVGTGHTPNRMSDTKVGNLMTKTGAQCGVRASFVRTRHTRATELLRRGMHVRALQHYLGHADLKSTMVYLEMDDMDLNREFQRTRKHR